MIKNILITGTPKSGKSTLLRKIISTQPNKVGFITTEIRNDNGRVGFELETHKGIKSVLAHIDFNTPHQVSKYFIDIKNLEKIIPQVEIGQMQLLSSDFEKLVKKYLDAENTLISTLSAVYQNGFTDSIRQRKDVYIVEISEDNRAEKEVFINQLIKKIEKARNYIAQPDKFVRRGNDIELKSEHGTRILSKVVDNWKCNCNFFSSYNICSHVIATQELYGN
jgi:nucleoside-triphosphatase THEP1